MNVLVDEKKEFKAEFSNLELGLANLIARTALSGKGVEFASASYTHPLEKRVILHIKGDNARKALEAAIKKVKGELEDVKQAIQ